MTLRPVTAVRRPVSLRGIPPRYQVFDCRNSPHFSVARIYSDPQQDGLVVFEVYDDLFREFLKEEEAFRGKRFAWLIDVDPNATHDTRDTIVRPHPLPELGFRGDEGGLALDLDAAVEACKAVDYYRVVR